MSDGLMELTKRVNLLRIDVDRLRTRQPAYSPRPTTEQIAIGVVTADHHDRILLLPESGVTDDLVTINGGADGRRLILMPATVGHTITVKNNTGNIMLQADRPLSSQKHTLTLVYAEHLAKWVELAYSVGGSGSGSDADTLDGIDSTGFALVVHDHDAADIVSGTIDDARIPTGITRDAEVMTIVLANDGLGSGLDADFLDGLSSAAFAAAVHVHAGEDITSGTVADARIASTLTRDSEVMTIVLAADGAGSGLDADFLDGLSSAAFAAAVHAHAGEDITSGTVADARIASTITRDSEVMTIVLAADGAASGLDADLLDGLQGAAYYLVDGSRVITGDVLLTAGKAYTFRQDQGIGTYSMHYAAVSPRFPIRMVGSSDSGNPRYWEIGYYTGDTQAGAWNPMVLFNSLNGITSIGGVSAIAKLNVIGGGLYLNSPEDDFTAIRMRPTDGNKITRIQALGDNAIVHSEIIFQQTAPTGAGNPTDANLLFATRGSSVTSTRMWLLGNGRLGVGVSPTARLHLSSINGEDAIYVAKTAAADTVEILQRFVYSSSWSLRLQQRHVAGSHVRNEWIERYNDLEFEVLRWQGGNAYMCDDTDQFANIGRTHIGAGYYTDWAWFSHRDLVGDGQYALIQSAGGQTILNAPAGQAVYFRINNNGVGAYSSAQWEMLVPLALGVSAAQGRIHGHDGTGGFIFASKTAIDGTAQVIVPNGTGDVTKRLYATYAGGSSVGTTFSGSAGFVPSSDIDIYNDGIGTNILKLRVNADGSVDVRRTAGTSTYTASFWLVWQ